MADEIPLLRPVLRRVCQSGVPGGLVTAVSIDDDILQCAKPQLRTVPEGSLVNLINDSSRLKFKFHTVQKAN